MHHLSFETSKRLDKLGLLKDIKTEFGYWVNWGNGEYKIKKRDIVYKTLTLEEAIEFIGKNMCEVRLLYPNGGQWLLQLQFGQEFKSDSVMGCYEQFLVYLLDNN